MSKRKGPLGLWDFPLLNGILGFNTQIQRSKSTGSRYVIAVSEDKTTISPVFARCWYFKIMEDNRTLRIVENPYREAVPAGPQAAEFVSSLGVKKVIAGSFGPVAERKLRELGVEPVVR